MNNKMKSFVKGILLSLVGKPLPTPEREPVAFLYNGVRLPKLPEWDREKYPYPFIVQREKTTSAEFRFIATESPPVMLLSRGEYFFNVDNSADRDKGDGYAFDYLNGEWVDKGEAIYWVGYNDGLAINGVPIWTEHEIYQVTEADGVLTYGEIYLPASEPVPVYE